MLASLAVKATAVEAWEAVKSLRIGSEAIRNATAQRLRTEFESIHFKEGETVDDFTMRLGSLVAELGTLGEVIKEQQDVQKLLRVILKNLSQVAVSIKVTQDLSKLTLEDAGGRLRAAKDRAMEDDALPPPRVDGKLLLTEEQLNEKMRSVATLGRVRPVVASSADARASAATAGRRERSTMTSVIIAGAPAIGPEIATNQGRSG
jgi:hypothetical protein